MIYIGGNGDDVKGYLKRKAQPKNGYAFFLLI
jgi:hypothetical protein